MPPVRFSVLGRVAVSAGGADVRIPGRRERAVLATLLAARRQVVSVDRLVQDVWGDDAGDSAQASLQVAVSRLRSLLEPDRAPRAEPVLLVSSGGGYALLAEPACVDAEQFQALVDDAHAAIAGGDPERARRLCEQAGVLWSGAPFAEIVDSDLVRAEKARLEDLRLAALEVRAEALLDLGRHALVTGELEALVLAHPFRERLWGLRALALYRSGRQAEALDTLRQAREVLADELGVDPSPALRKLEADLLAQESTLAGEPGRAGAPPRAAAPVDRSPVIGREDAMADLEGALDHVVQGGVGRVVVVSGDAGIGKTRLVTGLASTADVRGARVLWGRCHEADVSPAYWPWVPIVRDLADGRPAHDVRELLQATQTPSANTDADSAALRTYDAVGRLVATAAQDGPVVLVLEDIHWADTASLQLLSFAAEALREVPVLLVATVRIVEAPSAALQSCLAAVARQSAVRVRLDGLVASDVAALVARMAQAPADEELAGVLTERTDGNPFFVIELVRLLQSENRLNAAQARDVQVPDGVRDVLRLRLARLDDDVRALLNVASVAGRSFDLELVAAVSGRSVESALDLLDVAVSSHIIEEAGAPGTYRFAHALVRETLYESLTRTRRGLLHADIAARLEPRLAGDPELVVELAHHFVLGAALRPELAAVAVSHCIDAARIAEARGALDQALVHWEDARTADSLGSEEPRRRHDVLLGLGRARHRRGDLAGSRSALDAAVEIGRTLDDHLLMAEAATSFRGAGVWHWREFGTSDPALVAVLEECLEALPPGPLQARVQVSLAMEFTYQWRSAEAESVGSRAIDIARTFADHELFADVVSLYTLALVGKPGAAAPRIALAEEVFGRPISREQELYLRFGTAAAHLQTGDTASAVQQMTRCMELTRRIRHSGADVPIAWWLFYRAIDRGDDESASRLLDTARRRHELSSTVGLQDIAPVATLRLAGAGSAVPDDVVAAARQHRNPAFRAFIAHALAESGRAADGVELLGDPVPGGAWDYASVAGDCMRVDALAAAGLVDQLRLALARIAEWGHEFAIYGSTDCIGSIDYFIGRGHEGLGEGELARAAYGRAVEANREAGIVPWQRRAEARLGALSV